jgi:hypothetical protein
MKIAMMIVLLLIVSCASVDAKAPWVEQTLANKAMKEWRICNLAKDGAEKSFKGFCYITKECQKRIFKDACRPKPLFCQFSDVNCMMKYELDKKNLIEN